MICVYPPDCTDFSTNGLGLVSPSSCTVTETLNGEWELTLEHPLDAQGKWRRLLEGNILRAPVPAASTPQVKLAPQTGGGMIYRVSTSRDPLRLRSGTGTKYKILAKYKKDTEVIVLNKITASWYEVSCPDGKRGYMASQYLTYVRTETTPVSAGKTMIESRQLRDQPFRIYRVVPELTKITVYARHVFYDLLDNMIKNYEPSSSDTGATVAQNIASKCLTEHDFTFYSDLTSTADEVEFENVNPVDAMLGEGGLVEKYGAELARDWFDVFLVQRVGTDTDVQIREGKNLLGISYDVDITDVVTRIMPTGETKDGETLYLDELYLDSPYIGEYPHPKWIHLAVSEAKVSKDMTTAQAKAKMRSAAQGEYDKGCDLPAVTLKVDFINCAETEEYRQYRFLQNIYLGDAVRVIARRIGVAVSMRLTQYTYDCLTHKYTAMTLGTVANTIEGNIISSRQLASGTITGSKLAINSVGAGQLKDGSVGSLQIGLAAIQSAHIETAAIVNALIADAAITRAKIEEATIGALNAEALTAISVRIQELAAGSITTDALYAALATIANAEIANAIISAAQIGNLTASVVSIITARIAQLAAEHISTDNLYASIVEIVDASIADAQIKHLSAAVIEAVTARLEQISAGNLDTDALYATLANVIQLKVEQARAGTVDTDELRAALASIANAEITAADIDWAHIKDLVTDTAIITQGVGGNLYIAKLAVTEANMVSLTLGELLLKNNKGDFVRVVSNEDGSVTSVPVQVEGDNIADGAIDGSVKIIESSIDVSRLNAQSIFAESILVKQLMAANIDTDIFFAREATIDTITALDIRGNAYLHLYVAEEIDPLNTRMSAAEIKLTDESIVSTVRQSAEYQSDVQQTADNLEVRFLESLAYTDQVSEIADARIETIESHVRIEPGAKITLGASNQATEMVLTPDGLDIRSKAGVTLADFTASGASVPRLAVTEQITMGNAVWVMHANGTSSIMGR